ncbi:hypothetical protein E4U42_006620 [Claviceps africana]|uniref:FAD-binding domain-containing protein n=1 Tax=Claviceps africana TaxID=83212 RepID=A0A8K0J817_9HYPO|nr:hypothetical protein E4U42_006620 [Claviceps africana]
MRNEKPLRILIAGAGIAGPALAFWLQHLGHSITIVERWDSLRTGGQQIDLRHQGIEAVKRMGILEEIRQHVVDEAGIDIVNHKDRSIIFFPRHDPGSKRQGFSSEFEIMRGDLCRILHGRTREKVRYRFGQSVTGFDNRDDVVDVTFSDGSVAEYDLLVGADGQASRLRRALHQDIGGDEQFLRSRGVFTCYYSIGRSPEDKDHATCYLETGQRVLMTRWHTPRLGQAYLMTMAPGRHAEMREALKRDVAAQKAAFANMFKTVRWNKAGRILDAMQTTDDFYAHEIVQVRGNTWSRGRVVLLGDAAFCPSSMSGMGTSAAFVGAYVLAGEIARSRGDMEAALARYDATLRPFIDRVWLPPAAFMWLVPKSMIGLKVVNIALGLANRFHVPRLLQKRAADEKDDWVMPWYQELHNGEDAV